MPWSPEVGSEHAPISLLQHCRAVYSRYVLQSLDAILTADTRLNLEEIVTRYRPSNYRRIHTLVRMAHEIRPAFVRWGKRMLHRDTHLPLTGTTEFLGFGTFSTVYLHRRAGDLQSDVVIKVQRQSLGRDLETLLRMAKHQRVVQDRVCAWYEGTGVMVPVQYAILRVPPLNRRAVVGIQPFMNGSTRDLFDAMQDGSFDLSVLTNAPLRDQFRKFVERTVQVYEEEECSLDLYGDGNVLVLDADGKLSLQVVDTGYFSIAEARVKQPRRVASTVERIARLKALYLKLFGHEPGMVSMPLTASGPASAVVDLTSRSSVH